MTTLTKARRATFTGPAPRLGARLRWLRRGIPSPAIRQRFDAATARECIGACLHVAMRRPTRLAARR
jgi:hypothetical protein